MTYNNMKRQAGMTLLELTVVLLVLIGLAGMLLPYASGFIERTHDSTGADSIHELNAAIQRYEVQYMEHPGGYDALTTTDGELVSYLMGQKATGMMANMGAYSYLSAVKVKDDLTSAARKSLWKAGLEEFRFMAGGGDDTTAGSTDTKTTFNPTFNYYDGTNQFSTNMMGGITTEGATTTAAKAAVAAISGEKAAALFGIDDRTDDGRIYLVFGVGPENEMNGKTISEAPVHFAQVADMNASNRYNRFAVVYEVDNDSDHNKGGFVAAKFVGGAMLMSDMEGLSGAVQRHYDRTNEEEADD